ncbi:MAG TPA: hypothetical protein VFU37_07990 [Pyrinomonadaceae bacterium]|nr:hypothetical protein [Pyrinomonadaceae bacterium]
MTEELIAKIGQLIADLKSSRAVNVNSRSLKERVIETGKSYFATSRPQLGKVVPAERISKVDEIWQQVIRLAHGRNRRTSYLKHLRTVRNEITEFNVLAITNPERFGEKTPEFSRMETTLIETLRDLLPSAAQSYVQGMSDLSSSTRVSYRGTACEFREAFREVLDHLAPDHAVTESKGFSFEKGKTMPTMKQKVRFILKSRGLGQTQRQVVEKSVDLVEALSGDVARAIYDRASLSTHIETTRKEVLQLKRYIDTMLFDLLEIKAPS